MLNRNWQAIHVKTPAEAFCMLATGAAMALDIQGDDWITPVRLGCMAHAARARAGSGGKRATWPCARADVIVAANYSRVPMRRLAFGPRGIWERDGGVCQYTGRKLERAEGNIDHVIPRSRGGGATSWENCVLAHREVNSRKSRPPAPGSRLEAATTSDATAPAAGLGQHSQPARHHRLEAFLASA